MTQSADDAALFAVSVVASSGGPGSTERKGDKAALKQPMTLIYEAKSADSAARLLVAEYHARILSIDLESGSSVWSCTLCAPRIAQAYADFLHCCLMAPLVYQVPCNAYSNLPIIRR
jgi:hypothetical protein